MRFYLIGSIYFLNIFYTLKLKFEKFVIKLNYTKQLEKYLNLNLKFILVMKIMHQVLKKNQILKIFNK